MMYYIYKTLSEAQTAADKVNANYSEPEPINQGGNRHGQHPTYVKYCEPMGCVEGWAIIADEFTSQYLQGKPQGITFIETTLI